MKQLKTKQLEIVEHASNKKMIIINQQKLVIFGTTIISNMKVNVDKSKNLSVKEYLNEIKPCLRDIIVDLRKSGTWKIQLTIANDFISSKGTNEKQVMHSKSDNI